MQSEPTTTSRNRQLEEYTPETTDSSTQHGRRYSNEQAPPLPNDYGDGGLESSSSDSLFGMDAEGSGQDSPLETEHRRGRVNASKSPSPSPGDRISQYENAVANTPRSKIEGPAFEVIKTNRKPGDKKSPIAYLPNGVEPSDLTRSKKADIHLQRSSLTRFRICRLRNWRT